MSLSIAHGIDIVDTEHFRGVLERHPEFVTKIFTDSEQEFCDSCADPIPHYAARFAAKEATLKALGLGITPLGVDAKLLAIEVVRDGTRPGLELTGKPARIAAEHGVVSQAISLSHDGAQALASVVFLREVTG